MEIAARGYTTTTLGLPDDIPFIALDSGQRQLRINTWISHLFNHAEGASSPNRNAVERTRNRNAVERTRLTQG